MRTVIYKNNFEGVYYMTSKANYNAYIQNARQITKLEGVHTLEDVADFIKKACAWWGCKEEDFEVIG